MRRKRISKISMLPPSSTPCYQSRSTPRLIWPPFVFSSGSLLGAWLRPTLLRPYTPPSIHHTLAVELDPETHLLTAKDTTHLPKSLFNQTPLSFAMNPHLTIDRVEVNGRTVSVSKIPEDHSGQTGFTQWMIEGPSSSLETSDSIPTLTIVYHGLHR